ncbi:hypothetical protein M1M85_00195 [Nitrospinaceae bacterium]|nr:hypothetical protein [Nitrospinaceae bacterium]
MTKYLAIAFLITGFLVGDAYGMYDWDEEKAKSLGMPLVPVGAVIMCESEMSTGFNWTNGTYRQATFQKKKRILKKIEPFEGDLSKGCFDFKFNPSANSLFLKKIFGRRQACFKHHIFGEESAKYGGECSETYKKREGGIWDIKISCSKDSGLIPEIRFSPDGFYHLVFLHNDVSLKPKNNYKDSQYIEWGKCATISP